MAEQEVSIVIHLTPSTRKLLDLMHFGKIPEGAKYLAFLKEDGSPLWSEEIETSGFKIPTMTMISYYENAVVQMIT